MNETHPRPPNMGVELALLFLLATLWGASYTFIRVAVATIPPAYLALYQAAGAQYGVDWAILAGIGIGFHGWQRFGSVPRSS